MGLFEVRDIQRALEDVLARERTAIREGQYQSIEALAAEKIRLASGLERASVDAEALSRLKEQSERNALLYDAMRAGIGDAMERLRAAQAPAVPLNTYDGSGRRKVIHADLVKTSKRV